MIIASRRPCTPRGARLFALASALACVAALAGCSRDLPDTAPVEGKITYQGQPATQGKIMFYPEQGRPALGTIGPDGDYRLTTFETHDGALLGPHRVTIHAARGGDTTGLSVEEQEANLLTPSPVEWLVPEIYAHRETTPLTGEVTAGSNTLDFDLPTQ